MSNHLLHFIQRLKQLQWTLAFACLLSASLFVSACAKEEAAPTAQGQGQGAQGQGGGQRQGGPGGGGGQGRPPVPVMIGHASKKTMPIQITAVGNVETISTVSIKAQVAGVIQDVRFKEGDFVRKGQVLFTIDPRPFQNALAQAQATLTRDKATAANNRSQAERYSKLLAEGVVPASQVDSFVSAADASDAVLLADQAAIETAKLNLEYCTITSPIDGRTGSVLVKAGNLVKIADVPIVVINEVNPIYVNFTVPQQYWSDVKRYMARSTLHVMATVPRDPGPPVQGLLAFVDNSVDPTTGTIHVRGTFPNADNRLWPGLYVNVVLTLAQQLDSTVVPSQAVTQSQQGTSVYVVKPNNTVEQRPVVVGQTVEADTVIQSGVESGETIVIDGQVQLQPGARIEVKNPGGNNGNGGNGQAGGRQGRPDQAGRPGGPGNRQSGGPGQRSE